MASKLPRSRITDLTTRVECEVFAGPGGPMVWGTVDICYASEGVEPHVTIRVPVPVIANQSEAQRQEEALRRARKLIDHACTAIESEPEPAIPELIEGIAEELGVLPPTTAPKRARRG
jgi:hypothetical protein